MKVSPLLIFLLFTISVGAQSKFRLEDASKLVDVSIDVGTCKDGRCGPLNVEFFRKGEPKAFQAIRLAQTEMWDDEPKANVINRYDDQSVINFHDFNFDGNEDVAICDGSNGGYGAPSYRVYLYNASTRRYVYAPAFTKMNAGGLGMFETDDQKKMNLVSIKSGCCWHQTLGFDMYRGKPRKVYEFTEEVLTNKPETVEITTSKLVKGRWKTTVKHAKTSEYYK